MFGYSLFRLSKNYGDGDDFTGLAVELSGCA